MQLETRKLGILSMVHMPPDDNLLLDCCPIGGAYNLSGFMGETEFGWWFRNSLDLENWKSFGLSQTLFDTLTQLFALGYERIEFDRDGPILDELPQFDW